MTDRYSIISQAWGAGGETALDASCNDDSYATADEGCCDETEYLSVLESTARASLEGQGDVTLAETDEGAPSGEEAVAEEQQQVVIFSVEGSDELYGLQVAQDEDGNVKKYQFQLRTNEEGQLEAVPETIQLVQEEPHQAEEPHHIEEFQAKQEAQNNNHHQRQLLLLPSGISQYSESEVFIEGGDDEDGAQGQHQQADSKAGLLEAGVRLLRIDNGGGQGTEELRVMVKGEPLEEAEQQQEDDIFEELVEYTNETEELELHQELVLSPSEIKQEILNQNKSVFQEMFDKEAELAESEEHIVETTEEFATPDPEAVEENELTVLEYQNYPSDEVTICEGHEGELQHPQTVTETLASLFMEAGCSDNIEFVHETEETDTYEAVNHIQIAADAVLEEQLTGYHDDEEAVFHAIEEAEPLNPSNRIPGPGSPCKTGLKKPRPVLYYLMESQEKENLDSLPATKLAAAGKPPVKTHPRSILKGDLDLRLKAQTLRAPASSDRPLPSLHQNQRAEPHEGAGGGGSLADKRFARSKRAAEERLFHNFINRTTIPHAPVRSTRLPRKQQIRPVDGRRDEEIIVQEVMVSSGGCFVESARRQRQASASATTAQTRDKRVEVHTIELSDSEEETCGQRDAFATKKKNKRRQSVSEASEASVIEIVPSDEESSAGTGCESSEKMPDIDDHRDRSPEDAEFHGSPTKRCRTDTASAAALRKKEFTCPRCPKTFPSENSLSTHIQHHNLESCLRSEAAKKPPPQYNHVCEACGASFKNSFLLTRHACPQKSRRHTCGVCARQFGDEAGLSAHKKTHVKRRLVSDTNNVSICPSKFKSPSRPRFSTAPRLTLTRPSISALKPPASRSAVRSSSAFPARQPSPKKGDAQQAAVPASSRLQQHQCRECHKVCSTRDILAVHERSHRKFACATCGASFPSRLLLNGHLRLSCVKAASPKLRRLSFKVRRSEAATATPSRLSRAAGLNLTTMKSEGIDMQARCEDCGKMFRTLTALFKHRVKDHGVHTPDKRFAQEEKKKKLYRPLPAHCGIPAPEKLRKIWGRLEEEVKKQQQQQPPV